MDSKSKFYDILTLAKNNKKIIENYFFMTILQVLNSFFYLLIYPFLIKTLGLESYGLFVFATSIATYFMYLINYGFEMPALKAVAEQVDNPAIISSTLSCIFTAKIYLFLIATIFFLLLACFIPILYNNLSIFLICFLQVFSAVLFPQWYFQAIQKMRVVTYIQLGIKLVTLPFIFLYVTGPKELIVYTAIVSVSSVLGGIIAFYIINFSHKIKISFVHHSHLKSWFKDGFPFFLSTSAGVVKEQSVVLIIGSFFGMKDVAIYDLATKIVIIPRTIFMSINAAIFPKLINNIVKNIIIKIIKFEAIISILVTIFIAVIGKHLVLFMGGSSMLAAYPLAVLLSVTIMAWLVVGAYISFVFVPNKKYFLVTKNQLVALVSFVLYASIGLYLYQNILMFGLAMALSSLTEILYCKMVTKKYKML